MVVVPMAVCGCGKTTVGALPARRWRNWLGDADHFLADQNSKSGCLILAGPMSGPEPGAGKARRSGRQNTEPAAFI